MALKKSLLNRQTENRQRYVVVSLIVCTNLCGPVRASRRRFKSEVRALRRLLHVIREPDDASRLLMLGGLRYCKRPGYGNHLPTGGSYACKTP